MSVVDCVSESNITFKHIVAWQVCSLCYQEFMESHKFEYYTRYGYLWNWQFIHGYYC